MMKSPVFLAMALLLFTLAAVGYQAMTLNKVRLGTTVMLSKTQETKPVKKNDEAKLPALAQFTKQNLMGDPNKAPKKPAAEVVPIATLKLTLMGTIIKTDGGVSSAFIQSGNKETKRYSVGEQIEGGFTLDSVAADSVVLKRDDHLETLKYPANVAPAVAAQPPMPATNPATRPQPNKPAPAGQPDDANRAKSLRERMRAQANKNTQQNSPSK